MAKHKDETKKPIVRRSDEELEQALLAKIEQIRARKHAKDNTFIKNGVEQLTKLSARINELQAKHDKLVAEVEAARERVSAG